MSGKFILGVPACCAAQSACCGLRYRFGAVRTMRASTHALRMPNAKEVFFVGIFGFTHPPAPKVKGLKTLLFMCATYVYARVSA
jgi:hypothetical protein